MKKQDNLARFRFDRWPAEARRGALAESFVGGVRHGWTIAWYENGRKACEGAFRDGKEDGWWVFWDEMGASVRAIEFEHGAPRRSLPDAMQTTASLPKAA